MMRKDLKLAIEDVTPWCNKQEIGHAGSDYERILISENEPSFWWLSFYKEGKGKIYSFFTWFLFGG